jgi:hypothetical protein
MIKMVQNGANLCVGNESDQEKIYNSILTFGPPDVSSLVKYSSNPLGLNTNMRRVERLNNVDFGGSFTNQPRFNSAIFMIRKLLCRMRMGRARLLTHLK